MAAAALMALALGAIALGKRFTADWVSPAALIAAVWTGTLAAFEVRLEPYPPLHPLTWTVLSSAIALMVAGVLAGQWLFRTTATSARPQWNERRVRVCMAFYATIGLIGFAWYVWEVRTHLGWSAFADPTRIRIALGDYTIPSRFLFLQYGCLAAPLVAIVLAIERRPLSWLTVTGVLACVAATWLSTDRTQFFTIAIVGVFLWLHGRPDTFTLRRMAALAAIVAVLLAANFLIVARWLGKVGGSHAYLYATASYPAFDHALAAPPARTGGAHVFYPVVRVFQRMGVLDIALPSPIFDHTRVATHVDGTDVTFNGYTFLNYPYQDWGIAGALAYAACIGVICGLAYGRFRSAPDDPVRLVLVASLSGAILLSPFVNKFNNTGWWYVTVLTLAPFLAGRARHRRP
jgi:oligosaccharide repeat unit polymerase